MATDSNNNPIIGTKYENMIAYQSNPVIEAQRQMSIIEMRLFYFALLHLHPQLKKGSGDMTFRKIVIPTSDIMQIFGNSKYYSILEKESEKLQGRQIYIKKDENAEEFERLNVFRRMRFSTNDVGGLEIHFNDDMMPYLLELYNRTYTRIAAKDVFVLSSPYAVRLLELMLERQNIKMFKISKIIKRTITIDEFRDYCMIAPNLYKLGSNFTKGVINTAVKEINEATRYSISYKLVKRGKKTHGYDFEMRVPEDVTEINTLDEVKEAKRESEVMKATGDEVAEDDPFSLLVYYGVGKMVARRLVNEYDEKRIFSNIEYSISQKRVKNYGAYIVKAIREDFASTRFESRSASQGEAPMSLFDENNKPYRTYQEMEKEYVASLETFLVDHGIPKDMHAGATLINIVKNGGRMSITLTRMLKECGFNPDSVLSDIKERRMPVAVATVSFSSEEEIRQEINETTESIPSYSEMENKIGRSCYVSIARSILNKTNIPAITLNMLKNKGIKDIDNIRAKIEAFLNNEANKDKSDFVEEVVGEVIEDDRNTAGHETLRGAISMPSFTQENAMLNQLKELIEMKNAGFLTEEEFSDAKKRILSN